jgi:diguanylate cyclase (GGDEF)-like protein/PAS domain S-box-containing protein
MAHQTDFYKDLIDNMYDGVYFVNLNRQITYWNHGAERITGYSANQVMGRSCRDNLLNHVTEDGKLLCQDGCPLAACMVDGSQREVHVFLHHAEGYRVPVQVSATPIRDGNGNIVGAMETFHKMGASGLQQAELDNLRTMANTDTLTGLRNRAYLDRRIQGLIAEGTTEKPTVGILFIDIDQFKKVNDTYGHEIGDKVLKMVAKSIKANLRSSDIVGRWGGDEFIAIIEDMVSTGILKKVAEKIRALVASSRLDFENQSCVVTVSIGGTLLLSGDTRETLVNRADKIMYEMKKAGRNCVTVG